ncbi:MAG: recombinase family protein [Firmicutes bacterium]|nr:recombinase family protein [Bacillota bacterium]
MKYPERKINQIKEEIESKEVYNPYKYAAIYARRSILSENLSIETQIRECKEYLKGKDLILYDIYEDKISGKRPFTERDGFPKLLNHIYSGMFKTVILTRMDRLSRDIDDFIKIKNIFKKNNVKVIYIKEPEISSGKRNYMTSFIENMLMTISTFEPDNINERIKVGKSNARKNGRYPLRKSGAFGFYRSKEEPNKYSIKQNEADVVKAVFNIYVNKVGTKDDNGSTYKIIDLIDEINNSFLLETKFTRSNFNIIIEKPIYAQNMMIDPKYTIEEMIIWDDKKQEYFIKTDNLIKCVNIDGPIITLELWKKAILKRFVPKLNKPKSPDNYMFKNILVCGKCRKKLKLIENNYLCNKGCFNFNKDDLIKAILSKIIKDFENYLFENHLNKEISKLSKTVESNKNNLNKKTLELRKILYKFISDPSNKKIKDYYNEKKIEIIKLKKEIETTTSIHGQLKRISEDIPFIKERLIKILEDDQTFVNNNVLVFQDMLSSFIGKVVLTNPINENSKSNEIEVHYITKQ